MPLDLCTKFDLKCICRDDLNEGRGSLIFRLLSMPASWQVGGSPAPNIDHQHHPSASPPAKFNGFFSWTMACNQLEGSLKPSGEEEQGSPSVVVGTVPSCTSRGKFTVWSAGSLNGQAVFEAALQVVNSPLSSQPNVVHTSLNRFSVQVGTATVYYY